MEKFNRFLDTFVKACVDDEEQFIDWVAYNLDLFSDEYQKLDSESKDEVKERYIKIVETKKTFNPDLLEEMWYNIME